MTSSSPRPKVLVFAGSSRSDSLNRKLAKAAAEMLERAGAEVTFADLRDYSMPIYDGDTEAAAGLPERAKAFKELVRQQDGLVIASPEYNGSFSGLLKNTIDWISRSEAGEKPAAALRGKTTAILGASPGPGGGQRGLKHVRELLTMIGVNVLPEQLTLPKATDAFDNDGQLNRPEAREALTRIAADLVGKLHEQRNQAA